MKESETMTTQSLNGKNILITGSTKGIGLSIANKVAEMGATPIITGRDTSNNNQYPKNAKVYSVDLSEEGEVEKLANELNNDGIQIDVLINNAGTTIVKNFADMSLQDFDRVNNLNYRSVFTITNKFLPDIIKSNGGIVNILSVAARDIFTGNSLYSSSKAAVTTMMNVLREEMRDSKVDVVNVFPGATSTDLWPDDLRSEHEHKMMSADEVADAVGDLIPSIVRGNLTVEELVIRPKSGNI
ncbi:MAG: SDR family NAD(P)-dependent oxidoreductase [Chlorobiota bacterium]